MSLSTSVSAPVMTRFTSLSASRLICRTTRASLSNTCPSGTMRTSRMPLCSSARWRSKPRCKRWSSMPISRSSGLSRTRSVIRASACARWPARRRCSSAGRACGCRRARSARPSGARPRRRRPRSRPLLGSAPGRCGHRLGRGGALAGCAETKPPWSGDGGSGCRGATARAPVLGGRRPPRDLLDAALARRRASDEARRGSALRGHQDVELDRVRVGSRARRQVGDDLAVRLGLGLQARRAPGRWWRARTARAAEKDSAPARCWCEAGALRIR